MEMSLPSRCGDSASDPVEPILVSNALGECQPHVREILDKARNGEELSFEQSLRLAIAEGADLDALVAVANELRRETVGDAITYVVNRNINFTNVCYVGCSFCGFGRGPGEIGRASCRERG